VQVFAGMDLEAKIDAVRIEDIENRPPALGQLCKCGFDQAVGPLRPGIDVRPRQRAGKGRMLRQAQFL